MSTLYSHPDFPDKGPQDINKELMNRVSSNPLRLLMPQHVKNYIQALWTKKATGQPVTFTDIFGMLIGETLIPAVGAAHRFGVLDIYLGFSLIFMLYHYFHFHLKFLLISPDCFFCQRMDIKLSSIQEKINQAQSPLPLFTCLHVKPDVSELMFAGKYRQDGSFNRCHALSREFSHVMNNQ